MNSELLPEAYNRASLGSGLSAHGDHTIFYNSLMNQDLIMLTCSRIA